MPAALNNQTVSFPLEIHHKFGLICHGELEKSKLLHQRIQSFKNIIGVDGGIDYCHQLNIMPMGLVGDFDSVDPDIFQKMKGINILELERAKDFTDLQAAVYKAKNIAENTLVVVFCGLGRRIDHTLSNLFILLNDPLRIFFESENQVIFAVNDKDGKVRITHPDCQTAAIYPLSGKATQVDIDSGQKKYFLKDTKLFIFPFSKECTLSIGEGEVIVCLDKRKIKPFLSIKYGNPVNFLVDNSIINIFHYLCVQSKHHKKVILKSFQNERVFTIKPTANPVKLACKKGTTISLIPFYGRVAGIATTGLKWNLGPKEEYESLDKNFVGISNVSMDDLFSVQIESGELLCIINDDLIDLNMVEAKKSNISIDEIKESSSKKKIEK